MDNFQTSVNEVVSALITAGELPIDGSFLECFQDENGLFTASEDVLYDYKDEYPFSNSNNYFGGILRLICALNNTYGGIIIFGVDDKTRRAGKNKVVVDSERINRKLRESLTQTVLIRHKKYTTKTGDVDIILVPRRKAGVPPVRLSSEIGNYKPSKIFIRVGAEVLDAVGGQLEFLYGPRSNPFVEESVESSSVSSSLPPSPATIDEFIGRFDVVERAATRLTSSNEPRLFLWGNGGSGKSTIAYEFAKIIAQNGGILKNKEGKAFERVIYITAKKQYLNPLTAKIENFQGTDFSSSRELFEAILHLSNWSDRDLSTLDESDLLDEVKELLDIETQLIVIDDIDTLATSNEDAGMEQLFYIAARSRSGTKLLYTQRNLPSYALRSALEVPSLNLDEEFPKFITACCRQFGVPLPSDAESSEIASLSECRPLAIETIIGLRRITLTYADAMKRWKSDSSDARRYLFQREYDKLSSENRGRHLLATLCAFGAPQRVDVLKRILNFSDEQMQDAIAETRDMFLRIEHTTDSLGDLLSLGAATQSFLDQASRHLDRYSSIEGKVKIFKSETKLIPPILTLLKGKVARYLQQGMPDQALQALQEPELPNTIIEHPVFKACLGTVYAKLSPPRAGDAREAFTNAALLGYVEHEMFNEWLNMEKSAGASLTRGIEVCETVVKGNGFAYKVKAYFYKQLAYLQYKKTWEIDASSPDESIKLLKSSLGNNINAYHMAKKAQLSGLSSYFTQANESIGRLASSAARKYSPLIYISAIEEIFESNEDNTEFSDAISKGISLVLSGVNLTQASQIRRSLNKISGRLESPNYFRGDAPKRHRVRTVIKSLLAN